MQVKDILKIKNRELVTIEKTANVLQAMEKLISHKISCLPVVDTENRLEGIISDKDIFKAVYEHQNSFVAHKVVDLMTKDLLVGIEDDDMEYISGLMTNNRVRHIPIVQKDRLVGLISIGDVVKSKQVSVEIENRYLKQYIDGTYPA